MYGCAQYLLTPKVDKDGKRQEGERFDEGRIEIFGSELNPEAVKAEKNGCEKREYPCKKMKREKLEVIEKFFKHAKLPETLRLDKCTVVTDCELFIKSTISTLKKQKGNSRYLPYYDKLNNAYQKLKNETK